MPMSIPNADFARLKVTLEKKLESIRPGSNKREEIMIQQNADALDQTQFATERDLVVSLINRESEMSRRVRSALRRIEEGTFGSCAVCEEQISVKRLQAVPWAELCLDCQARSDLNGGAIGTESEQLELGVR